MMTIYSYYHNQPIPDNLYFKLLANVAYDTQQRIKKFRFRKDAERTLIGRLIVKSVLRIKYDITSYIIENNQYGKPIIQDKTNLNFNISHSGDWIVVGFDSKPIGIDIELIQDIDRNIAKSFFSDIEYQDLLTKPDSEWLSYFYQLWSLKESYIKACGKGLSIPLKSFYFQFKNKQLVFNTEHNQFSNCNFFQYTLINGYALSICTFSSNIFDNYIEKLSIKDLL